MTNPSFLEKSPNFVLFQTADSKVNIDVYFHGETLWLSQRIIAELGQKAAYAKYPLCSCSIKTKHFIRQRISA